MIDAGNKFEIVLDRTRNILRTRARGDWDVEYAQKYKKALKEKIRGIHADGKAWYILADFQDFYPLSEEVQRIMSQLIFTVKQQGMQKIAYLGKRSWMECKLQELFQPENRIQHAFFESQREAIEWMMHDE